METTDPMINFIVGAVSFVLLVVASWCVGEGGEILGKKYDASIIGGLVIAWLNTGLYFNCLNNAAKRQLTIDLSSV